MRKGKTALIAALAATMAAGRDSKWEQRAGQVRFGEAAGEGLAARVAWVLIKYAPFGANITHESIREHARMPNAGFDPDSDYEEALVQLEKMGFLIRDDLGAHISEQFRKHSVSCAACGAVGPHAVNAKDAERGAIEQGFVKRLSGFYCPIHKEHGTTRQERKRAEREEERRRHERYAAEDREQRRKRRKDAAIAKELTGNA